MTALMKILYAPVMLIGFNGFAVWLVSFDFSHGWLVPLLMLAISVSFLVERMIPYSRSWNENHEDRGRDVFYAVMYEASVFVSIGMIPLLTLFSPTSGLWPSDWPLVLQLLAAIFVADLGITIAHFASHRIEWLWRFHAPHHSVKRMYGFNGLVKHPVHQLIETTAGTLPLVAFGMPMEIGALLGFAIGIQLLLQHSNVDMRIGALRYVLALAPLHRFHHQKWAGVGDVNFGLFTNLWDYLLGTAVYDANKRFASEELGIGKQPDYPVTFLGQLAAPFRRQYGRYGSLTDDVG